MGWCNRCRNNDCRCGIPAVPQPYNRCGEDVAENHTQMIFQAQYSFGITVASKWNIPACGGSAILKVPGILNFPVGEFLHHEAYGYFKVIAFSVEDEEITIQNPCLSENAAVGSQVAACTTFSVGPAPCCEDTSQSGVYVAVGFTAPSEDHCIDIEVTSQEGLIAGNLATIGTGVYRLIEVKADNIITICNDGEGITPGSPVIAKNPFTNEYQYSIISISVNPCSQTKVGSGVPLVCVNGSGYPLGGLTNGILSCINATTGESAFTTAIPSAVANLNSQMGAILPEIAQIHVDTAFLQGEVETINNTLAKGLGGKDSSTTTTGTLSAGNTQLNSGIADLIITNNSGRSMYVMYTAITRAWGNIVNGNVDNLGINYALKQRINISPATGALFTDICTLQEQCTLTSTSGAHRHDLQRVWTDLILLAAGQEVHIEVQGTLTWIAGTGVTYVLDADGISTNGLDVQITAITVTA